ncbi:solute carrier family 28 member 3-like [Mya arenaria]|uniref:solute carrier family 28 member 3-like n=1 Tax=Mya arenaria TaxID=6604 RepID=UPI0022E8C577|nr:solute carrier family 28 member 3-like [Mya arenaria]XP_052808156.1 solute carrier family 28 member 3-like [Mya arenaria]
MEPVAMTPPETEHMNDANSDVNEDEHDANEDDEVTNPYQNVTMDMNSTKDTDQMERQEIKLDMDVRNGRLTRDPLSRLDPMFQCLHRFSPLQCLIYLRLTLEHALLRFKAKLWWTFLAVVLTLFIVYIGVAFSHRFGDEGSLRLLVVTLLILLGVIYHYVKKLYGVFIYTKYVSPVARMLQPYKRTILFITTVLVGLLVLVFVLVDVCRRRPASLISLVGMAVFTLAMFFFSTDPRQVTWRPVLWGLLLQLIFALVVLRTSWGYAAFLWLGDRVTDYLGYTFAGSTFVFGQATKDIFAFSVMPVLIFFSASIAILYYLGVIQVLIEKIAFVMQISLGTSAMESLHAAINIFVGWAEAITVVRPYMLEMSLSELHTIMTNGFATVAGSTLAIYILYGAPANHLLSASVMSAPAALAMSKLFYPETRENRRKKAIPPRIPKLGTGIIDAASIGAVGSISIVAHILVSVIAFFALLAFVNATLEWFGDRVGLSPPDYPALSFELICSYVFWPIVFLMGVAPEDCRVVARMVGIKTFVNEFLAYEDLGKVRNNRVQFMKELASNPNTTWTWDSSSNLVLQGTNMTFVGGVISPHSEMVATYALCGFSNVVALGIMIGALAAVAPDRKSDILGVSIRALISGSVACFMTACIAGLLGEQ